MCSTCRVTALLKNHGYSVRSVWGNNLKCSKAVLGAGYAVRGTRWKINSRLKAILGDGYAVRGTRYAVRSEKLIQDWKLS